MVYTTLLIDREDNAIKYALQNVTDCGLIRSKQDYMAVHKVMMDVIYRCPMSCPAFIRMLDKYGIHYPMGKDIRPSAGNIRKTKFYAGDKYAYPNWRIIDGTASQLIHYKEIAATFLDAYYLIFGVIN